MRYKENIKQEQVKKVTRLAFSLWNVCNFDREQDIENKNLSANYNVSEIFSCSYAPYFYEAIRIRYPEYTREISKGITKENNFER